VHIANWIGADVVEVVEKLIYKLLTIYHTLMFFIKLYDSYSVPCEKVCRDECKIKVDMSSLFMLLCLLFGCFRCLLFLFIVFFMFCYFWCDVHDIVTSEKEFIVFGDELVTALLLSFFQYYVESTIEAYQ
jgi:hypothetical protein